MLQSIVIKNYAIIKDVTINFKNGLHVITGETGAGKSILLGALAAILGERFDNSKILNSQEKCLIEGSFDIAKHKKLNKFLTTNEFDADDQLILRREITAAGKSRAFINDTPATLQHLQTISNLLVDLHQQFDTQEVASQNFQIEIIDALAENNKLLGAYKLAYTTFKKAEQAYAELKNKQSQLQKDKDYDSFLFNELEQANFKANEIEEAEAALKIMNSAEAIALVLQQAEYNLLESEAPIIAQLKQTINSISTHTQTLPALELVYNRLLSAHAELDDIANELQSISGAINYDAEKFAFLQERIDIGYRLLKKHSLQTTEQLLQLQESLSNKLNAIANADDDLLQLENQMKNAKANALNIAQEISAKRNSVISNFLKKLHSALAKVEMPNAQLKIELQQGELNSYGMDALQFLLDANKSGKFSPIQKVASGGELSRLMLCIKSLVADKMELPTMIFDEIDTGISGEACKQVGIILEQLAKHKQIICITHQPQIAAKGNTHFFVSKKETAGVINTLVKELQHDERTLSIAQMIGGANPTEATIKNAKEMMGIN